MIALVLMPFYVQSVVYMIALGADAVGNVHDSSGADALPSHTTHTFGEVVGWLHRRRTGQAPPPHAIYRDCIESRAIW